MANETEELADVLAGVRMHARHGGVTQGRAWSGGRERRAEPFEVTQAGLGPESWTLQVLPMRALDAVLPTLRDLEADVAEPNICFGAEIMRTAYPRLARQPRRGSLRIACLWHQSGIEGEAPRLDLFTPVSVDRVGWPGHEVLRIASNEFLPVGTPLVRSEAAADTVCRFLDLLASPELPLPRVLLAPDQRMDGPVARAFEAARYRHHRIDERRRAVILSGGGDPSGLSSKRRRDFARQRRRLEEQGTLEHRVARSPSAIADAMEAFVALELASWKGDRGTALYSVRSVLAFAREAVIDLAASDRAAIHSLTLDDTTIASLVVLGSGSDRITWKMAFDAAQAAHSPGVQLMLEATRTFAEAGNGVDSLAVPDHPVMDRVWSARRPMADLAISLDGDARTLTKTRHAIERRQAWRNAAKSLLQATGLRKR